MKTKYRIDGIDYDTGSDEFLQAVEKKIDAADKACAALTAERDKLQGRCDSLDAEVKQLKATDIDALVKARVAVVKRAEEFLGSEYKSDGKSDREVMVDAIVKSRSDFKAEGRSDDYVTGVFESLASPAAAAIQPSVKHDRKDDGESELTKAFDRNLERSRNAWNKPNGKGAQ